MDPQSQNKFSPKILMVVGVVLLVLILGFSVLTLSKKDSSSTVEKIAQLTPLPTIAFTPPPNFIYSSVDSLNFLPTHINDYTIDQGKISQTSQQAYPGLVDKNMRDQINNDVVTWLALNQYYETADPSKVSTFSATKKITDIKMIKNEVNKMKADYNQNVITMDGWYLKLRFLGTLDTNLQSLHKKESELQPFASQLMSDYRNQAIKDSSTILDKFNNNNTVLLLNNREASKSFSHYQLYPPLMGDENYYTMMQSLPVGQVSDIITLKSKINGDTFAKDYAYAVFYIKNKTGTNLPLDVVVNTYVEKAKIQ